MTAPIWLADLVAARDAAREAETAADCIEDHDDETCTRYPFTCRLCVAVARAGETEERYHELSCHHADALLELAQIGAREDLWARCSSCGGSGNGPWDKRYPTRINECSVCTRGFVSLKDRFDALEARVTQLEAERKLPE